MVTMRAKESFQRAHWEQQTPRRLDESGTELSGSIFGFEWLSSVKGQKSPRQVRTPLSLLQAEPLRLDSAFQLTITTRSATQAKKKLHDAGFKR